MAAILVVDDSTTMRQMVAFTLTSAGHEVVEAPDGNKALGIAKQRKFDLVITDVNMPGMNGIDLVQGLRELPDCKFIRIPVITHVEMPGMNGLELIKELRQLKSYQTTPILILARDASDVNIKKAETLGA